MRQIVIGIIIFAVSCFGTMMFTVDNRKIYYPTNRIGIDFQEHVHDFEVASKIYGADQIVAERLPLLKVKFGDPKVANKRNNATCWRFDSLVVIEKKTWDDLTKQERQGLIDHELGHCVLGRVHRHAQDESGLAKSVMNPMFPTFIKSYLADPKLMRQELFNDQYFDTFEIFETIYSNYFNQHPGQRETLSEEMMDSLMAMFGNIANNDEDVLYQNRTPQK